MKGGVLDASGITLDCVFSCSVRAIIKLIFFDINTITNIFIHAK